MTQNTTSIISWYRGINGFRALARIAAVMSLGLAVASPTAYAEATQDTSVVITDTTAKIVVNCENISTETAKRTGSDIADYH